MALCAVPTCARKEKKPCAMESPRRVGPTGRRFLVCRLMSTRSFFFRIYSRSPSRLPVSTIPIHSIYRIRIDVLPSPSVVVRPSNPFVCAVKRTFCVWTFLCPACVPHCACCALVLTPPLAVHVLHSVLGSCASLNLL